MTTNSTTPRTDALAFAVYNKGSDYAREHVESLARTLERELAETRDELNRVTCERDGFRHQAARARHTLK